MLKHLPNFLTCCNILCGCLGIIQVFKGDLVYGCYFVFFGVAFDFLDGLAARMLKAYSPIGKDLDSLADMVTFGMLPGFLIYYVLKTYTDIFFLPYVALIIPIFSALRLAKFNNDTRQTSDFIGLPTPANALFFISFPLIILYDSSGLRFLFQNPIFIISCIIVFSGLLVSEIKLFSLKIKRLNINENIFPLILIVLSNVLFFILFFSAIPFIIFLYIILSLVKFYILKDINPYSAK